jgi:hypothetical protein
VKYDAGAIDGTTLEKRRDQRAEVLERFLHTLTPEDRQGIEGTVNSWTRDGGVEVLPAPQSVFNLDADDKRLRPYQEAHAFEEPDPIVKRTPEQRLESMVKRLIENGVEDSILSEVAGEYWKQGAPVTVDALRAVASHFLNRADGGKAKVLTH